MNGKTHVLFGSVLSLYLLPKLGIEPNVTTTSIAAAASLIPDIDHPSAKINQQVLPMKNKLGKMMFYCGIGGFLLYQYGFENRLITGVAFLSIIVSFSHHRGFTHSIVGILAISATIIYGLKHVLQYSLVLSFIIGLLSHLLGDWMTVGGIELFYPITNKRYRFPFVLSTGNVAEGFICVFLSYLIINFYLTGSFNLNWIQNVTSFFIVHT